MDKSKGYEDKILGEQVRLAIQQAPTMQIGSLLSAFVLAFTVRNIITRAHITAWLLMVMVHLCGRIILYYKFRNVDKSDFVAKRWENVYLRLALFSGIIWGLSAFIIFPVGDLWQMSLFVIVIAGMSAGTTTSHASIRWGSTAWVVPVLMLYAVRCFMEGGEFEYVLGLFFVIFMAVMILHSLKNNKTITSAISLKFENTDLLAAIRESEERFRRLSEAGFEGIVISEKSLIIDANKRVAQMLGCELTDLIGKKISEVVTAESLETVENHIRSGSEERYEHVLKRRDGTTFPVEAQGRSLPYEGRILRVAAIRDITERKEAEKRIRHLAYYDSLTGLPNRTFYKELVDRSILFATRRHWTLAILFIDLDKLKRINDTLGHNIGDELLRTVSDLMRSCIRKSDVIARSQEDGIQDVVARLGGDEFIVLLNELAHAQDASMVARRILKELARPFVLAGHEVFISASIGIALYPLDGNDADSLLKNADVAMYQAKVQGGNNYQFYMSSMNATSLQRLALENDLRKATGNGEFLLYYQPIVDVKRRTITGAEALIRWNHPVKGLIPPMDFIPLAEETGLIVPIGEWVLRTACFQNKAWQDKGNEHLSVAVNLSSRQFDQDGFVEIVSGALRDSGLDPKYLELEITESTLMKNPEKAVATLRKLEEMGMCLAIDDFGTGYSSLGNLRKFPLDTLKIDRSFTMNITTNSDDAAITTAIIAMARSLKLGVIAEGVESEEQQTFLRELGCDEVQGYLFSRPVPAEEFIKIVREKKHL